MGGELDDAEIDAVLVGGQGAFEATFWSDGAGGAGVGASNKGQSGFDGAKSRVEEVLFWRCGAAEPCVIGEVDEDLGAVFRGGGIFGLEGIFEADSDTDARVWVGEGEDALFGSWGDIAGDEVLEEGWSEVAEREEFAERNEVLFSVGLEVGAGLGEEECGVPAAESCGGGIGGLDDALQEGLVFGEVLEKVGVDGFEGSDEESGGGFCELGLPELVHFPTGEEAGRG